MAMPESSQHWKQKLTVFEPFSNAWKGFIPKIKLGGEYDPKHPNKETQERNNMTSFHSERSNIQRRY